MSLLHSTLCPPRENGYESEVTTTVRGTRRTLLPLALVFLAVGVSTSMFTPYLSLFLDTAVHAGPVRITVFLIASPLSGVVASTLLGRLSDRLPIRRRLIILAALGGLAGTGTTAFVRNYWILLALTVTVVAPRS